MSWGMQDTDYLSLLIVLHHPLSQGGLDFRVSVPLVLARLEVCAGRAGHGQ